MLPIPGPRKGYVKFREHGDAVCAVEAAFGTWSESERVLSSQRSKPLVFSYFHVAKSIPMYSHHAVCYLAILQYGVVAQLLAQEERRHRRNLPRQHHCQTRWIQR